MKYLVIIGKAKDVKNCLTLMAQMENAIDEHIAKYYLMAEKIEFTLDVYLAKQEFMGELKQ